MEKARSHRTPNLCCREAESPGQFDVLPKKVCTRCDDEVASHQFSMAVALWIIWIVSVEECSSLMQNLMQICCSTCSVILNAMATQDTCSLNNVYHPHWLVQGSGHCSHTCIPVHSPWLPGYMEVRQTVLAILTMAGLFLDRPHRAWRCWTKGWFISRQEAAGFHHNIQNGA